MPCLPKRHNQVFKSLVLPVGPQSYS
uniref:Uncharacterized protein n=1 Tax=Anguilla anguilla TaxID=7936 RepID=A0A0E9VPH1_ANGAN